MDSGSLEGRRRPGPMNAVRPNSFEALVGTEGSGPRGFPHDLLGRLDLFRQSWILGLRRCCLLNLLYGLSRGGGGVELEQVFAQTLVEVFGVGILVDHLSQQGNRLFRGGPQSSSRTRGISPRWRRAGNPTPSRNCALSWSRKAFGRGATRGGFTASRCARPSSDSRRTAGSRERGCCTGRRRP